jgi:multisubunit Na+/H+ antiporter MnhB subunit
MSDIGLLLDLALCVALLFTGWRVLHSSDHFQAVVLFITFGLILALAWVRLEAPDIAIAEAAVGAGLAGVMLLDTLRMMKATAAQKTEDGNWQNMVSLPRYHQVLSFGVVLLLLSLLIYTVLELPRTAGGLADLVSGRLEESGTKHPVTAVLLNFRGYDTWVELGILLLALLGVLCIRKCSDLRSIAPPAASSIILENLVLGMMPLLLLVAGYLLWRGGFAPGGAFQAGVVLGAAVILLWMAGYRSLTLLPVGIWRVLITIGFLAFLLLGTFSLLHTGIFLAYDRQYAGLQIFLLESAAALSIGTILAGLVLALQPLSKDISS